MKIKNLTIKPIGFGSTVILPDEIGTLPQGYGKNHPTVKYYLSRKWIKEIGGAGDSGSASAVGVDVSLNHGGTPTGNADSDPDGGGADNSTGDPNSNPDGSDASGENTGGAPAGGSPNKSLDRMNKEELQALAFQRGIQFVEADTRQVLIDKIKAAQSGNE